jgi:hypothetical protein
MSRFVYEYEGKKYPIYGIDIDNARQNAVLETFYRIYSSNPKMTNKVEGKDYYQYDKKRGDALSDLALIDDIELVDADNWELYIALKNSFDTTEEVHFQEDKLSDNEKIEEDNNFQTNHKSNPKQLKRVTIFQPIPQTYRQSSFQPNRQLIPQTNFQTNSQSNPLTNLKSKTEKIEANPENVMERSRNIGDRRAFFTQWETDVARAALSRDMERIRSIPKEQIVSFFDYHCDVKGLEVPKRRDRYVGKHANIDGIRHVWTERPKSKDSYQAVPYCRSVSRAIKYY